MSTREFKLIFKYNTPIPPGGDADMVVRPQSPFKGTRAEPVEGIGAESAWKFSSLGKAWPARDFFQKWDFPTRIASAFVTQGEGSHRQIYDNAFALRVRNMSSGPKSFAIHIVGSVVHPEPAAKIAHGELKQSEHDKIEKLILRWRETAANLAPTDAPAAALIERIMAELERECIGGETPAAAP